MKKKLIIHDRLLLAALAGTVSAVAANTFLYLVNIALHGQTVNMPQITLEIFLNLGSYTILQRILGFIWSLIIGGTYAFIYVIILDWTGWRSLWLKSIIVVSGTWLFMAGMVMKMMKLSTFTRDEPLAITAFYIAHLVFASVMSLSVRRYSGCCNHEEGKKLIQRRKIFRVKTQSNHIFIKPKKI